MTIDNDQENKFCESVEEVLGFMRAHKENWGAFDYMIITSGKNIDELYVESEVEGIKSIVDMIDGILTHCMLSNVKDSMEIFQNVSEIFMLKLKTLNSTSKDLH